MVVQQPLEEYMSNLIASDVQGQEPGNLINLYELDLGNGTILYYHAGLEEDLSTVQFRDRTTPTTIREYAALPIMMDGIEVAAEGASPRPTLTIANILSTFRDALGGLTNDNLVGKKITRRQTLKEYLFGESGDANPPVEFPIKVYIIDRILSETSISVSFELASPFDLGGVKIPNRVIVGQYCSWIYQGASVSKGGCVWAANSVLSYNNSGSAVTHKAYFTIGNEPIVLSTDISGAYSGVTTYASGDLISNGGLYWRSLQDSNTGNTPVAGGVWWDEVKIYTVWANATAYSVGDYVERSNTVWLCILAHTSASGTIEPETSSIYWERGDLCGKQLNSCKCRFQFIPKNTATANSNALIDKDTTKSLPFGGFPGSLKFR